MIDLPSLARRHGQSLTANGLAIAAQRGRISVWGESELAYSTNERTAAGERLLAARLGRVEYSKMDALTIVFAPGRLPAVLKVLGVFGKMAA